MKTVFRSVSLFSLILGSLVLAYVAWMKAQSDLSSKRITKEGLTIDMSIAPVGNANQALQEGRPSLIQFTVRDETGKEPIKGLHPSVWMDRQNPNEKPLSCKERITSYLQGSLGFQPEINLNSYFVLALNNKASISVIDPLNGFGNSKLITRIRLNSLGADWVISKDQKTIYVALPLTRQVAVIDTELWKVASYLPFQAAPTRLALQPDGKYLWVGLETMEGKTGVSAIDTEKLIETASFRTGTSHHEFAFSSDSRTVFVGNAAEQTISLFDGERLELKQTIHINGRPVSLAYSAISQQLYAATANGDVSVVDDKGHFIQTLATGSPLKAFRFHADGRWGFGISQKNNKVFIFDASANRLAHRVDVGSAPDQISFTEHFAYVRSTDNETVSMLQLDALGKKSSIPVTTFPAGQKAPGETGELSADAIASTPEHNAVIVANPSDKAIYYYMEGMAAPMGNFENFGLSPMALMVVDKSMQETAPGVYSGNADLPPAGSYSVAVLLDKPPVYHCFTTEISPDPNIAKNTDEQVKVEFLPEKKEIPAGKPTAVRLKIVRPHHQQLQNEANDLEVLFFRIPGLWQQRLMAAPEGDGVYKVDVTPPEAGVYQIFVQSELLKFTFDQQPSLLLQAIVPQISTAR